MGRVVHYGIQHVSFRHNLSTDTSAQWLKRIVAYFIFTSMLRRIATTTAGTVAVGSITYVSSRRKKKKTSYFQLKICTNGVAMYGFSCFFFLQMGLVKRLRVYSFFWFQNLSVIPVMPVTFDRRISTLIFARRAMDSDGCHQDHVNFHINANKPNQIKRKYSIDDRIKASQMV